MRSKLNLSRDLLLRALFVFAGYYFGSKIGFALTFQPYAVSTLWPTNAILLSVLLMSPTQHWPILILAALPAHLTIQLQSNVPYTMVFCWFISNTFEALIGAGLIRKFLKDSVLFTTLRDFNLSLFCAALLAPFLSSFLDSAFVILNRWATQSYWHIWKMRFFSNVLAGITIVPFMISWKNTGVRKAREFPVSRYMEGIVLLTGLTAVTFAVFNVRESPSTNPGWIYLPLPFLLWAAGRFGLNIVATAILIVSLIAIWGSIHSRGPFHVSNPIDNAFYIQMSVIVFAYPLLLFAVLLQERKAMRLRALAGEERFRLALSAARMSTWDLNVPATGLNTLSKQYESIAKKELQEDYLNLGPSLSIHQEDRPKVEETIRAAIDRGGSYEMEFRVVGADNEELWRLGKGEVLSDEKGRPSRVLGINVDITERKRAEEERRDAERLAQMQRQELFHLSRVGMLGELSGTVAHELNQPLTAILSNAQAAQRYLKKENFDLNELRQIMDDVIEQDRRAGDVIKRMRALLKKGDVERRPLNMNDLAKDALELAKSEFITHSVDLLTSFRSDLPSFQGDRIQMQQVFLNLFINAVESMMSVKRIDRKLKVSTEIKEDSMIQLAVTDSGTGVPPEQLNQIFEPFHTTKEHGLGLGLAISRAIVVAHGGQLRVENNLDHGATFFLSIPPDASA